MPITHSQESYSRNLRKFLLYAIELRCVLYLYKKQNLYKKLWQTCRFLVQVDLGKIRVQVSWLYDISIEFCQLQNNLCVSQFPMHRSTIWLLRLMPSLYSRKVIIQPSPTLCRILNEAKTELGKGVNPQAQWVKTKLSPACIWQQYWSPVAEYLQDEFKKSSHNTVIRIVAKHGPIFKVLSLARSAGNLQ